jgi:protein-serine/threonine kinase
VLVADPSQRLGYTRGAPEIKSHGWFRGLRWALLRDEAPPLLVVDPARAAEEAAAAAGTGADLEPLNSVLAR